MADQHLDEGIDELIAEMDDLYADYEAAAKENWEKRQAAESPGGPEGEEGEAWESEPEREYQAELFLVIPHHGNKRKRPLKRRSQGASPPLDSAAITVTPKGSNTPTDRIKPGNQYTVECTVQNAGGVGTSAMTVELFEAHKQPDAVIDTTSQGVLEQTYGKGVDDTDTVGITTFPPNDTDVRLVGVMFVSSGQKGLRWDTLVAVFGLDINDDRTFWGIEYKPPGDGDPRATDYAATGKPIKSNTFTMRAYDISAFPDKKYLSYDQETKQGAKNLVSMLKGPKTDLLFETKGRWVKGRTHNHQKENVDLSNTVSNATIKKRTQTNIAANSRTTVSFTYTAPPSRNGRALTELYARAYSLAPADTPRNWGTIDHTKSRFVGRTELYWPFS